MFTSSRDASSRGLRAFAALVATIALAAVFAATAQALPRDFWGASPQGILSVEQFERLKRGGVESIRLPVVWGSVQPDRNGEFDWSGVDVQMAAAAEARLDVLPFLAGAPRWAVRSVNVPGSGGSVRAVAHLPVSGAARGAWIKFVKAAIGRYGPRGTFWSAYSSLPRRPLRIWQIWNEPNFRYFVAKPNPVEYGKLVKLSYSAIKAADPGARVLLAGLFSRPNGSRTKSGKHKGRDWYASDFLEKMYQSNPGIKAKFDGAALHPYTGNYKRLTPEIEEVRTVLKRNHDAGLGLWLTELGWSSQHPTKSNSFAKGVAGQARELRRAFKLLKAKQARWRLKSIYWFSIDDQADACNFCDGSGLFGEGFKPKKAWYEYVKFTGGKR